METSYLPELAAAQPLDSLDPEHYRDLEQFIQASLYRKFCFFEDKSKMTQVFALESIEAFIEEFKTAALIDDDQETQLRNALTAIYNFAYKDRNFRQFLLNSNHSAVIPALIRLVNIGELEFDDMDFVGFVAVVNEYEKLAEKNDDQRVLIVNLEEQRKKFLTSVAASSVALQAAPETIDVFLQSQCLNVVKNSVGISADLRNVRDLMQRTVLRKDFMKMYASECLLQMNRDADGKLTSQSILMSPGSKGFAVFCYVNVEDRRVHLISRSQIKDELFYAASLEKASRISPCRSYSELLADFFAKYSFHPEVESSLRIELKDVELEFDDLQVEEAIRSKEENVDDSEMENEDFIQFCKVQKEIVLLILAGEECGAATAERLYRKIDENIEEGLQRLARCLINTTKKDAVAYYIFRTVIQRVEEERDDFFERLIDLYILETLDIEEDEKGDEYFPNFSEVVIYDNGSNHSKSVRSLLDLLITERPMSVLKHAVGDFSGVIDFAYLFHEGASDECYRQEGDDVVIVADDSLKECIHHSLIATSNIYVRKSHNSRSKKDEFRIKKSLLNRNIFACKSLLTGEDMLISDVEFINQIMAFDAFVKECGHKHSYVYERALHLYKFSDAAFLLVSQKLQLLLFALANKKEEHLADCFIGGKFYPKDADKKLDDLTRGFKLEIFIAVLASAVECSGVVAVSTSDVSGKVKTKFVVTDPVYFLLEGYVQLRQVLLEKELMVGEVRKPQKMGGKKTGSASSTTAAAASRDVNKLLNKVKLLLGIAEGISFKKEISAFEFLPVDAEFKSDAIKFTVEGGMAKKVKINTASLTDEDVGQLEQLIVRNKKAKQDKSKEDQRIREEIKKLRPEKLRLEADLKRQKAEILERKKELDVKLSFLTTPEERTVIIPSCEEVFQQNIKYLECLIIDSSRLQQDLIRDKVNYLRAKTKDDDFNVEAVVHGIISEQRIMEELIAVKKQSLLTQEHEKKEVEENIARNREAFDLVKQDHERKIAVMESLKRKSDETLSQEKAELETRKLEMQGAASANELVKQKVAILELRIKALETKIALARLQQDLNITQERLKLKQETQDAVQRECEIIETLSKKLAAVSTEAAVAKPHSKEDEIAACEQIKVIHDSRRFAELLYKFCQENGYESLMQGSTLYKTKSRGCDFQVEVNFPSLSDDAAKQLKEYAGYFFPEIDAEKIIVTAVGPYPVRAVSMVADDRFSITICSKSYESGYVSYLDAMRAGGDHDIEDPRPCKFKPKFQSDYCVKHGVTEFPVTQVASYPNCEGDVCVVANLDARNRNGYLILASQMLNNPTLFEGSLRRQHMERNLDDIMATKLVSVLGDVRSVIEKEIEEFAVKHRITGSDLLKFREIVNYSCERVRGARSIAAVGGSAVAGPAPAVAVDEFSVVAAASQTL